jgi:hypothetical protein
MSNDCLWLEVSNVRTEGTEKVQVQLKGDRTDKEPFWWDVADNAHGKVASETSKEIFRALDSKRVVLAGIGPERGGEPKEDKLVVRAIRVLFSDSGSR